MKYIFFYVFCVIGLNAFAATTTPSLSGTNIPLTSQIVDAKLNVWTVVSGVVYENGKKAGFSGGVTFLLYDESVIYQSAGGKFWSWDATTLAWVGPIADPRVVSPKGTNIPVVSQLVDEALNIWTLSGGVVYKNGELAGSSANAIYLLYENGVIYHENTSLDFYAWVNNTWSPWNPTSSVDNLTLAAIQARNAACIPFGIQTPATYEKSTHKVFAHYMPIFAMSQDNRAFNNPLEYYTNSYMSPIGEVNDEHLAAGGYLRSRPLPVLPSSTNSVTNYEREVRLAMSIGIDGFSVDIGGLGTLTMLTNMLAAIKEVNAESGAHFTLLPVIDAVGFDTDTNHQADIITLLETLRTDPNIMRLPTGQMAFSAFYADEYSATVWSDIISALQTADGGKKPAFVPIFLSLGAYNTANGTTGAFDKISYMISTWGARTPNGATSMQTTPATFHAKNLGFMMPVAPQDFRPKNNSYQEATNSETFRNAWESAIKGGADWVQIVTWNDYSENTHVEPSSGTQYGFYDLAAYYISLYKGYPSYIGRDTVALFYRNQLAGASGPTPNAIVQTEPIALIESDAGATNYVEAVVFTDANDFKAGDNPYVAITVGGVTTKFNITAAGLTTYQIPLKFGTSSTPGAVSASVVVGGVTNVSVAAPTQVNESIYVQNFLYQSASNTQNAGAVSCGFPNEAAYDTSITDIYRGVASSL